MRSRVVDRTRVIVREMEARTATADELTCGSATWTGCKGAAPGKRVEAGQGPAFPLEPGKFPVLHHLKGKRPGPYLSFVI